MPAPSERTRVRRHPERARYEREVVDAILDEAPICHVAFVAGGTPFAVPTIHARAGDTLYLHGSPVSRMLRELGSGIEVCVTATILDGLVFARSAFHHSMNYRSAMVVGRCRQVVDPEERMRALEAVVEHVAAGRWAETRHPDERELKATEVLAIDMTEASAKVRTGPPIDAPGDVRPDTWAGVMPLRLAAQAPEPSGDVEPGLPPPPSVEARASR